MKTLSEYLNFVSSAGCCDAGGRAEAFPSDEGFDWGRMNFSLEIGVPESELLTVKIGSWKRDKTTCVRGAIGHMRCALGRWL
ncbi:hypothetical protein E3N88_19541 [Mikania micrantha]|uniref:Uncharacterized protein n=1 Tax=Mikania micrantha TaxID=192012 RepID=A0A5N6NQW3_9ASTR|nr:hypothetical protein E3N88_19541 [Mikania micrantha]